MSSFRGYYFKPSALDQIFEDFKYWKNKGKTMEELGTLFNENLQDILLSLNISDAEMLSFYEQVTKSRF